MTLRDLAVLVRFVRGLRRYAQQTLSPEKCRDTIASQMRDRVRIFLNLLERGVFGHPASPYRRLLDHAGLEFDDVAALIREHGLEPALHRLYDAGVYVTHDEFNGRRPIRRGSLEFRTGPRKFDNPLIAAAYETRTGGSRSAGTRVAIDFDFVAHEATYMSLYVEALGMTGKPWAMWRPPPPFVAGMKGALRGIKLGTPPERWFSPLPLRRNGLPLRHRAITAYAVRASRMFGCPIPKLEHVPPHQAVTVAGWLAEKKAEGTTARLDLNNSATIRVCQAAKEHDMDIRGCAFVGGGEPLTPGRYEAVRERGVCMGNKYSMTEVGNVGLPCGRGDVFDEVHLAGDKLALIQRESRVASGEQRVEEFFLTTLLPACPKILINFGTADYGVVRERDCGCPVGRMGFRTMLHDVRAYDKLTSEGVTFHGDYLFRLLEQDLPARFGGDPMDYQIVEEENAAGLAVVSILVSPRVGDVRDDDVVTAVLESLGSRGAAARAAADSWREGALVRVLRETPRMTEAGKILPLHVSRK